METRVLLLVLAWSTIVMCECPAFKNVRGSTVQCAKECLETQRKVYGTINYHEDSSVCHAALHASAIGLSGGSVSVEKSTHPIAHFFASLRNRIVSEERDGPSRPYRVKGPGSVTEEDLHPDMILAHNSYFGRSLRLTCFSQDPQNQPSTRTIVRWDFEPNKNKVQVGETFVTCNYSEGSNYHAFGCLGRSTATDIMAAIQKQERTNSEPNSDLSSTATVRGIKGRDLKIPLVPGSTESSSVPVKQFPGAPRNMSLPLVFRALEPYDAGLYNVGSQRTGAYFILVVKDCEDKKFGPNCESDCQDCQHGGQCHPQTGTCVCPAGYYGSTCEHACPPGWFGAKCQLTCNEDILRFPVEQDGACKGVTLCVPLPQGCSCAPGYTGPLCDEECADGTYGVNCQLNCPDCARGHCHRVTGTCTQCSGASCISPPPSPKGLSATVPPQGLNITWQNTGDPDVVYFITYQGTRCKKEKERQRIENATQVVLDDLTPLEHYNVCVVASGRGGHSTPSCIQAVTAPDKINFSCRESTYSARCTVSVPRDCSEYLDSFHLNVTLETYLPCNHSTLFQHALLSRRSLFKEFQVVPGQPYHATLFVTTTDGQEVLKQKNEFRTGNGEPPAVRNFTAAVICQTQVRLLWNDPCPPHGNISQFNVYGTYIGASKCRASSDYERCHTIENLRMNSEYTFYVSARTSAWGGYSSVTVSLQEVAPGPPLAVAKTRRERGLKLAIRTPTNPGGLLLNCSLILIGTGYRCETKNFPNKCPAGTGEDLHDCQEEVTQLMEGTKYEAETWCCNSKFCGERNRNDVATTPLVPSLSGALVVQKSNNTTITIGIPTTSLNGEGDLTIAIVVERVQNANEGEGQGMRDAAKELLNRDEDAWTFRHSDESEECNQTLRIAAELREDKSVFVIGDGLRYGRFRNCPLESSQLHRIGLLVVNDLLGEKSYAWQEVARAVKTEEWEAGSSVGLVVGLLILVLLMIVALGFVMYRYRDAVNEFRKALLKDQQRKNLVPNETETQQSHAQVNGVDSSLPTECRDSTESREPVYENFELEDIYSNQTLAVTRNTIEAYLNRIISSQETAEEFKTVPQNVGKTMGVGSLPENLKKNRFKNNLPYDDTRVILSMKDNIPSSDYINANHVKGYKADMRYIATQGPKSRNMNTVGDFWRMAWEQEVSVIIMVANFIEDGKEKVAEYITVGKDLELDDMTVRILSRESLPHFAVSRIKLYYGDQERDIWHYQFTSWPDHGVPNESVSLASMTRHVRSHHTQGVAVVHCSAGIGRTGTILMVLLLLEMLDVEGSIEPISTLTHLRNCRARLVESYSQYNLALQVFDEVLFGTRTVVALDDLYQELPRLVSESPEQFRRLKSLPSPLTYKMKQSQEALSLTRNHMAFPSDSHRICLSFQDGIPESQYINAIRVQGATTQEALLVTEHPMACTIDRFWRLVTEKLCPMVVFINEYFSQSKEEFPVLLPNHGDVWTVGEFQVQTHSLQPFSSSLSQARVSVTNSQGETYSIVIYQVEGWEYGEELPLSLDILVTLADLILQSPRGSFSGPPLLCCGDGVTACGLVACVTLVLERATIYQSVDIYRAAVMLLRCRQQFITSEAQFAALHEAASLYLQNFSTYSNIS